MKTKQEIEQLAKKSAQKKYRLQHIPLEQIDEYGGEIKDYVTIFIQGYTQCHEYMANKYRESKLREAKDVIAAFIKGYSKCQEDNDWTKGCECESSIGQTLCCNQCGLPHDTRKSKITRFEVIDEKGRAYTTKDCKVELSYQDDGRTLKVFIKPLNKQD